MIADKLKAADLYTEHATKMFDTLVVSRDHTLFFQLSSFFKEFEPGRKPVLADSLTFYETIEESLNHCETILFDMRAPYAVTDLSKHLLAAPPNKAFTLGIATGQEACDELLALPVNNRLAGFISPDSGWRAVWHQISAITAAWYNPQVISRIEEVPVNEILQMISCNRWSSNVFIDGTLGSSPAKEPLRGCISFFRGEPHTAWSWRNAGNEAIFDLLSVQQGLLQVIKNHCTPLYRNIYHQTDELILSHAVAQDESSVAYSFESPIFSLTDSQTIPEEETPDSINTASPSSDTSDGENPDRSENEPIDSATDHHGSMDDLSPPSSESENATDEHLQRWRKHGPSLLKFLERASEHSLPLRWMTEEAFCDLTRTQPDAVLMIFYGNATIRTRFFASASRSFSSMKLADQASFPVVRLGNSNSVHLYIAGVDFAETFACAPCTDAFAGITEEHSEIAAELINKQHKTLQLFTDQENNTIFESIQTSAPVHSGCTFKDWPSCAATLSTVVSSLMQRT